MSKTITSPVKRFPGTVTLPDFLTFPQAIAWEEAQADSEALRDGKTVFAKRMQALVPGFMAVVQEWNLENFSLEPFQSTPRGAVIELCAWLIGEVTKLYDEAEEIPNA
jgi:hypothetical protein